MSLTLDVALLSFTDPRFLAAGAIALLLVGYVVYVLRQQPASTGQAAGATGGGQAGVQDLDSGATSREADDGSELGHGDAETEASEPAARKGKLTAGKGRTLAEMVDHDEIDDASLLSRFVLNAKGDTLGETMALTDEQVVLKTGDGFAAVSLEAIIEKDGMLLVDANIDWDQAHEAGQEWKKASLDTMEYDDEGMPVLDD